jgi:hypothetical protein
MARILRSLAQTEWSNEKKLLARLQQFCSGADITGRLQTDIKWYSKCYCGASVVKTYTLKGV